MTQYHPTATDITDGVPDDVLTDLPEEAKAIVRTLLARVSERSYRRGVQQGVTVFQRSPGSLPKDLHDWRYGTSTDLSVWADFDMSEASVSRLYTENMSLRRAGLWEAREAE
ncbi:hypothetical protein [Sphingomonas montana]|uniref:hypothetical protein n=1 Tax=Sphingomonas montana TaxID=1843236 RepID=UPI00096D8B74|nr:hypothetical protein [Sphingomonas montana]